MSRINTNVSSLVAQKTLNRSQQQLQTSLSRLSTGLRINAGKDDPAGLIASENLRRDITAAQKAITNTQRATQLISTADSALGQISGLLNDVRGLVTESANTGVQSDEQIAANQLQVDSSLEAIDRISQTTTFQGRKLLDGSLDFISNVTSGKSSVSDLQIHKATLNGSTALPVDVSITAAASQAQLTYTAAGFTAGAAATGSLTFSDITTPEAEASSDLSTSGLADASNIVGTFDVKSTSTFAGAAGNSLTVAFAEDNATATSSAAVSGNTLTITVGTQGAGATIALSTILTDLSSDTDFTNNLTSTVSAGNYTVGTDSGSSLTFAGGVDQISSDDVITVAAANTGTAYNGTLSLTQSGSAVAGSIAVAVSGGNVTVTTDNSSTYDIQDITDAINTALGPDYTATFSATAGDGNFVAGTDTPVAANLSGGTADTDTGLAADLSVKLSGNDGSEVFSFDAGATLSQIVSSINLLSDSTGVQANNNSGTLELKSTGYGSRATVSADVVSEGTGGDFATGLSGNYDTGSDIVGTINGYSANGSGNTLSINTSVLGLSLTVNDGSSTAVAFNITGGGAVFQLGPDVVRNQQARVGIGSVNTAELGGTHGRLFQLRSGNSSDLTADPTNAARIVDDAINKVTSLRGRLGAFQKTTLETNINSLNDTITNLTEAESSIRDADFASETANLTRAQILVQSGTSVLQIANSNPQQVLSLLRG